MPKDRLCHALHSLNSQAFQAVREIAATAAMYCNGNAVQACYAMTALSTSAAIPCLALPFRPLPACRAIAIVERYY